MKLIALLLLLAACRTTDFGAEKKPTSEGRAPESDASTPQAAKDEPKRPDLEGLEPALGLTLLDRPAARDVELSADVALGDAGTSAGLAVRVVGQSYYLARLTRTRAGETQAQLALMTPRGAALLASVTAPRDRGRLTVTAKDARLTLALDGTTLAQADDATLGNAGALASFATGGEVANVSHLRSVHLALRSTWAACAEGAARVATPEGGGWSAWSQPLATSDAGSPRSCLEAKLYAATPLTLELETSRRSDCATTTQQSAGDWSGPLVTADWDGAPWTCLRAKLTGSRRCKLELRSAWRSDCQTGETTSTPDWSAGLITSRWDGAPWSCLEARVVCE